MKELYSPYFVITPNEEFHGHLEEDSSSREFQCNNGVQMENQMFLVV